MTLGEHSRRHIRESESTPDWLAIFVGSTLAAP